MSDYENTFHLYSVAGVARRFSGVGTRKDTSTIDGVLKYDRFVDEYEGTISGMWSNGQTFTCRLKLKNISSKKETLYTSEAYCTTLPDLGNNDFNQKYELRTVEKCNMDFDGSHDLY